MEIICPPGIKTILCQERMRQLRRLKTVERFQPPVQNDAPPLPPEEIPVDAPAPPAPAPTPNYSIDMPYVPEIWSRGDDIRSIASSSANIVVYGPPEADDGLTHVSDLMAPTHVGPVRIY